MKYSPFLSKAHGFVLVSPIYDTIVFQQQFQIQIHSQKYLAPTLFETDNQAVCLTAFMSFTLYTDRCSCSQNWLLKSGTESKQGVAFPENVPLYCSLNTAVDPQLPHLNSLLTCASMPVSLKLQQAQILSGWCRPRLCMENLICQYLFPFFLEDSGALQHTQYLSEHLLKCSTGGCCG